MFTLIFTILFCLFYHDINFAWFWVSIPLDIIIMVFIVTKINKSADKWAKQAEQEKENEKMNKIEYACSIPLTDNEFRTLIELVISNTKNNDIKDFSYYFDEEELFNYECERKHIVFPSFEEQERDFNNFLLKRRKQERDYVEENVKKNGKPWLMKQIEETFTSDYFCVEIYPETAPLLCKLFPHKEIYGKKYPSEVANLLSCLSCWKH